MLLLCHVTRAVTASKLVELLPHVPHSFDEVVLDRRSNLTKVLVQLCGQKVTETHTHNSTYYYYLGKASQGSRCETQPSSHSKVMHELHHFANTHISSDVSA